MSTLGPTARPLYLVIYGHVIAPYRLFSIFIIIFYALLDYFDNSFTKNVWCACCVHILCKLTLQ